jgi:hypothetical protein
MKTVHAFPHAHLDKIVSTILLLLQFKGDEAQVHMAALRQQRESESLDTPKD